MTATLSSADMVKILAAANGSVAQEYTDHDLVCTWALHRAPGG